MNERRLSACGVMLHDIGSETRCHFVSDRLAVHLTDAPVHAVLADLDSYVELDAGHITVKVRSQGSNVVKSEMYRKFRRGSASR